jgi:hypothetical protein
MSKQKFYLADFNKLEITEKYLETTSEYFEYCSPWRFDTIEEAKIYIKEKLKSKIKKLDEEIAELNLKRDELMNQLINWVDDNNIEIYE